MPVVAGLRLDAEQLARRRQGARAQRAAGQQPAAAQRDEQRVERADLLEQFLGHRPLAGDDVGMIERRDQREAALCRQCAADLLAILGVAVVGHDGGAVAARRVDLGSRRVRGHHEGRRDAQQA